MKLLVKNGLVYRAHHFEKKDFMIEDGKVFFEWEQASDQEIDVYDAEGLYIIPGFIDIHTHGAVGIDVNAASEKDYEKLAHFYATQGTTAWQASILTDSQARTLQCLGQARQYIESQKEMSGAGAELLGIHLEGPFLSETFKGAMPAHLLKIGDAELVRTYQEASGQNIHYMTVSPEVEGVPEVLDALKKLGIKIAIGHSAADYEQAMNCIKKGVSAATHTFNAMKPLHHHEPAITGAVLESDIYCEAILDGRHLHPGAVRLLLKVKGYDKVIAITDSIMAAGLPDGEYYLGVNEVVVKDGDARLKIGDARAGSTLTMIQAFHNALAFTEAKAEQVIPLFTENPARMLGFDERIGYLETGYDADFLVMDQAFTLIDTFVKGALLPKS